MRTITVQTSIGADKKLTIVLPNDIQGGPTEVVVILNPLQGPVDLQARGWTSAETAETRSRLKSFDEDWNAPGLDAYDAS